MNHVLFNRRRLFQTYRHVAFTLQILSFIATIITYRRILEQQKLPLIFLVLPLLLGFLVSLNLFVIIRDRNLVCILRGAITGFIGGFLSTVVVVHEEVYTPGVVSRRPNLVAVLSTLEFLHLPVVSGAVMYTFCLMFSRLPPLTIVILSVATSTCGAVIFSIGRIILQDSMTTVPSAATDWSSPFIIFIIIFTCSMMPSMNRNCRTWVLCAVSFGANVYWQSSFLDTLQWNWDRSWFPIPGFFTGVIVLFLLDVVEFSESGVSDLPTRQIRKPVRSANSELESDASSSDGLTTAITWHAIAYIVERTSLTIIMENRGAKSQGRVSRSDAWLCCLGMLGVVAVLTLLKEFSQFLRVLILMLGIILYVCLTVTNGRLANGFFIDSVFGIALLTTSSMSDYVVPVH